MKTNQEIQVDAERLVVLGHQYRDQQIQTSASSAAMAAPQVLVRLPDSQVTSRPAAEPESVHHHLRQRHIDAALEGDVLLYRLVERETETAGSGLLVREGAPAVVMVSQSGFDLLQESYLVIEEERLAERLTPYAEWSEDRGSVEPIADSAVSEVEEILETNQLSPYARLRAKTEIVEFLEGRMDAGEFITHAIEGQGAGEDRCERIEEQCEMKLTIGEP